MEVEVVVDNDDIVCARIGIVDLADGLQLLSLVSVQCSQFGVLSDEIRRHVRPSSLETRDSLSKLKSIQVLA